MNIFLLIMNILDTHTHNLRFKLDWFVKNNLKQYNYEWKEWKKLKKECETTDNKIMVDEIKNCSKLESNKNLPYLQRCEGGLGGDDNKNNKQIRFRINWGKYCSRYYIEFNLMTNTTIKSCEYVIDEINNYMSKMFVIIKYLKK